MKNSILVLKVVVIAMFFFASCKKKPHEKNAYIPIEPDTCDIVDLKPVDFKKIGINLDFISYGVSKLASNPEFVSVVHEQAKKRFDGDENALVREIDSECRKKNIDFSKILEIAIAEGFNVDTIKKYKLAGFPVKLEEYGLFPQIYIPSFELTQNNNIQSGLPIVVSEQEMNWKYDSTLYVGYGVIKENEKVSKRKYIINEEFYTKNLTWIISINESVNCRGNINGWTPRQLPEKTMKTTEATSAMSACDPALVNKYKQIEFYPKIIVDNKKEGGNKKGELKYAFAVWCPSAYTTSPPWMIFDMPLYRSNGEYKIKSSDIGQYLDVHHHFINQPLWRDNHHIALIVYEYDWAGSTSSVFYELPYLTFKSNETPYWTKKDYNWFSYSGSGCWGCYTITSHHNPGQILFDIGGWEPTQ